VSFQLSSSYDTLQRDGRESGQLLDMSMFTDPPLPYSVYKGSEVVVRNRHAPVHLFGQPVVAGFPTELWGEVEDTPSMLPRDVRTWVDMGIGVVVGGFYQIHHDSVSALRELDAFMSDNTGRSSAPSSPPRRRVVMCIEFPPGWTEGGGAAPPYIASQQQQQRTAQPPPVPQAPPAVPEGAAPVYEWWFGDRPTQEACGGSKPFGFWKRYHPKVCQQLEACWQRDLNKQTAWNVDGVRYMITCIEEGNPFDYTGYPSRDPFDESLVITTAYPCYEELDRATGNCLVQFHKGNPALRRPARRRPNPEEIASNATRTGEPCGVCFSEDGELTGCNQGHVICKGCLRGGLRVMAGDVLTVERLLCGCFNHSSQGTVRVLAARADASLQTAMSTMHTADEITRMDLDMELTQTRTQFGLQPHDAIDPRLYTTKIDEWYDKVRQRELAPLYHVCAHPDCATKVEHWILRDDFEQDHRARGETSWVCPAGHHNTVLPSAAEMRAMNRNLLLQPDYYTESAPYSEVPLRRYRLCNSCATQGGVLMLAEHGGECKQWPGYGRGHHHTFCFACTRTWGDGCNHGNASCRDPGIQQVRRNGDRLEIGFINGQEYMRWLRGEQQRPPPTVFTTQPRRVEGEARQQELGMEDRAALMRELTCRPCT